MEKFAKTIIFCFLFIFKLFFLPNKIYADLITINDPISQPDKNFFRYIKSNLTLITVIFSVLAIGIALFIFLILKRRK